MTETTHPDTVLIIDFGSQVTQLIARRVREAGVYSEIVPFQSAAEAFARIAPKAVILSGSPHSTVDIGSPRAPDAIFEAARDLLMRFDALDAGVRLTGVSVSSLTKRPDAELFPDAERARPAFPFWASVMASRPCARSLAAPWRPVTTVSLGVPFWTSSRIARCSRAPGRPEPAIRSG